jgi:rhodanese-related sulfurtransferase|tara:strand:+ start:24 stop:392 length:369 start_codon:yes stop_codon:yes gene_type:complete
MNYEIILIILVLILISLGLLLNIKRDNKDTYALNYKEARDMIRKNKFEYIIDIRSEREYNAGRFPGAIHIPIDNLRDGVKLYDMRSSILLYEGPRAAYGKIILNDMGFNNVMYLKTDYNRLI